MLCKVRLWYKLLQLLSYNSSGVVQSSTLNVYPMNIGWKTLQDEMYNKKTEEQWVTFWPCNFCVDCVLAKDFDREAYQSMLY